MSRREVRGPGVAGIAVIAKPPPVRPPEHLIYERRRDDERREVYENVLKATETARGRAMFETTTDMRIRQKRVATRAEQIVAEKEAALEARRERLRRLLASEDQDFASAAAAMQETPIERMARMRQTVRALRDKREEDRLAFSQAKQEEAWRANCDSLRTATTRQEHSMVNEARRVQQEQLETLRRRDEHVDRLYDTLWEQDRLAKEEREQREAEARAAVNATLQREQLKQMQELEDNRRRAAELRAEAQRLRLEEARLMEEEDERRRGDKRAAQERMRRMLDRDAEARAAYIEANTVSEQQADLDLLDRLERERLEDAANALAEKQQLARETQAYHQYLREMAEFRRAQETEFDAACLEEMRRSQRKQNAEWRAQRERRTAMMNDVIATRRQQLAERQEAVRQEQAENEAEAERIRADVEAHEREKAAAAAKQRAFHDEYGQKLGEQIAQDRDRRERERQTEVAFEAELQAGWRAEEDRVTRELASLLSVSGSRVGGGHA